MTPLDALLIYATLAELAIIVFLALGLVRTMRRPSRDLGEFNLTDFQKTGRRRGAKGHFVSTKDRNPG